MLNRAELQDRRFYSCVANMVLLPMPLKAFTDTILEVICARNLYGWHCDHQRMMDGIAKIEGWDDCDVYPKSWPRGQVTSLPLGES
jgi:hypothetical protein